MLAKVRIAQDAAHAELTRLRRQFRHDLRVARHGPASERTRGAIEALHHAITTIDVRLSLGARNPRDGNHPR